MGGSLPDSQVLAYWRSQLDVYTSTLPTAAKDSEAIPRFFKVVESDTDTDTERRDDLLLPSRLFCERHNSKMALIASLFPRLEGLEAVLCDEEVFPFAPPGSMPALRAVKLSRYDGETGKTRLRFADLQGLARAAPNLETLLCAGLEAAATGGSEGMGGLRFPLLREVDLQWSAMDAGALRALLGACPRLERFAYKRSGWGWAGYMYEQFSLHDARDLTSEDPRPGALKRVVLYMPQKDGVFGRAHWEEREVWGTAKTQEAARAFGEKGVKLEVTNVSMTEEKQY